MSTVAYAPLVRKIVSSVAAIDPAEWNALVPRNEPHLRADFLQAVEHSGLAKQAFYLTVRAAESSRLLGIAVVYCRDIDILTFASSALSRLAERLRRGVFQRFLIVRALACGPLINNGGAGFFVDPQADRQQSQEIFAALAAMMESLGEGSIQVFYELADYAAALYGPVLLASDYIQGASLPGTRLDIRWRDFDGYVAAMRKLFRRTVRKDLQAGADLDIRVETDFSHLAEEACALYTNVVERAQIVDERLTPAFFAELGKLEQTRLVTVREKTTGRLIGIELLLMGDDVLQDVYTGFDYGANPRHHTYFNLVYPGIRLACEQGLRSMSLGQTSYDFKSRLGATPYPLHIFAKHRNPLLHWVLRRFRAWLCPTVRVKTHQVFRTEGRATSLAEYPEPEER